MAEVNAHVNVLISSKQREFAAERADIRRMMKPLPLLVADAAEDWPPQGAPIRDVFLQEARGCAIYVGLFGCVYSHPTVLEYEAAAENRYREMLVYVKDCPGRQADLSAFLERVNDPDSGRTIVSYSDWDSVRPRFEEHLWAAIGRMIEYLLKLGRPPVAMGAEGALECRWAAQKRALGELGLPVGESEALELAELLEKRRNYF